mmetsp:Transcript_12227/g.21635  ORF Transcript_12227/g.21635 Transcript_12227/m.21635 type:complete len:106 (-) Transcript_12227:650-967(-)
MNVHCAQLATVLGPAYGEAYRDIDRLSIDSQEIADSLWTNTGLGKVLQKIVINRVWRPKGCNPNIRLYRYQPGHRFGKHVDGSVQLEDGMQTWYTVLIYLSGQVH